MTKEEIGVILKGLRISCGMTQKEVATLLNRKQQVVGHWETGYSQPDANTLFNLCNLYKTTVDEAFGFKRKDLNVSKEDISLIKKYHTLDNHGKEMIDSILNKESDRITRYGRLEDEQTATLEVSPSPIRLATYYQRTASAGIGEYLLDDMYESTIAIKESEMAKQSDFAIGITGDSMEPLYKDGDIVLVKAQQIVEIGEIGIFILNRESYIKQAGKDSLISLNPNYPEIPISDSDSFRCVGKVIGKAELAND